MNSLPSTEVVHTLDVQRTNFIDMTTKSSRYPILKAAFFLPNTGWAFTHARSAVLGDAVQDLCMMQAKVFTSNRSLYPEVPNGSGQHTDPLHRKRKVWSNLTVKSSTAKNYSKRKMENPTRLMSIENCTYISPPSTYTACGVGKIHHDALVGDHIIHSSR